MGLGYKQANKIKIIPGIGKHCFLYSSAVNDPLLIHTNTGFVTSAGGVF